MDEGLDAIILGAGAVGLTIASDFYNHGKKVAVVSRKRLAEAISKEGIKFNNLGKKDGVITPNFIQPDEKFEIYHEDNAKELKQLKLKKNALILLASKTPDLKDIVSSYLTKVYDPQSEQTILLLQNGICPELEVLDQLKSIYGDNKNVLNHVISSLTMARVGFADYVKPTIDYILARIIVGAWDNISDKKDGFFEVMRALERVSNGSAEAKFTEEAYREERYRKALQNGANVLSAMFGIKVCEIVTNPFIGDMMLKKIAESVNVARSEGIDMDLGTEIKQAGVVYSTVVKEHLASMAQDVQLSIKNPTRKITTEINHLDGGFYKIGSANNVDVSFNGFWCEYMNIFTESFNILSEKNPEKASEYAKKVIATNRSIVGLDNHPAKVVGYSPGGIAYELAKNLIRINKEFEVPKDFKYLPFEKQQKPVIKIIRVDDEEEVLKLFSKQLEQEIKKSPMFKDYQIEIENFTEPQKALDTYRQNPQDYYLVYTDQRMPGFDGTKLVNEMNGVYPIAPLYDTAYFGKEFEMDRMKTRPILTSKKGERNLDVILGAIFVAINETEKLRRLYQFYKG